MSWLGNLFTGNSNSNTNNTTNGTFAGVGQTTPSTLPYTIPTTHINPSTSIHNPPTLYTYTGLGINNTPSCNVVHVSGESPTISTDKIKIDLNELGELIPILKERLLIITPNFEKHEKYAALKKAYDNYKLIETMLGEDNDNK